MAADLDGALRVFALASDYVDSAGLLDEVEWQRSVSLDRFTETDLLREAAWVILCSGFRETIVRRCFDQISLYFCDWESASAIIKAAPFCKLAARSIFRNEAKLNAIVGVATYVEKVGFAVFKRAVVANPIRELRHLPHIGAITVWHLAKNLGLNAAKPDRHLVRISKQFGFRDVESFCAAVADATGEEVKVVDIIVWRFLADKPQQGFFTQTVPPNLFEGDTVPLTA